MQATKIILVQEVGSYIKNILFVQTLLGVVSIQFSYFSSPFGWRGGGIRWWTLREADEIISGKSFISVYGAFSYQKAKAKIGHIFAMLAIQKVSSSFSMHIEMKRLSKNEQNILAEQPRPNCSRPCFLLWFRTLLRSSGGRKGLK